MQAEDEPAVGLALFIVVSDTPHVGVLCFLLVLARYRRLGPSLAAFLLAVLAAATSLSLLVLAGYEANLMHLVGG